MITNLLIKATSKDGIKRDLVFNDTIILIDKNDSIEIPIIDSNSKEIFKLIFRFDNDGVEYKSTLNSQVGNVYDVTLHGWDTEGFTETSFPWNIIVDKIQYWINWRTSLAKKVDRRVFHISIWRKNND